MLTDLERQADIEAEEARQAFIGVKDWYASKGVWGGIVALISLIAGGFGYVITPEEQEALVVGLSGLGATVGVILGIVGRVKADRVIA